ncbi:MAG TPA: ATP-binding protein [Geobacteraceae bacterium]
MNIKIGPIAINLPLVICAIAGAFIVYAAFILLAVLFSRHRRHYKESEERFRQLFEQNDDAIILFKRSSGEVIDVNPASVKLFCHTREEFLRRGSRLIFEPNGQGEFLDFLASISGEGHRDLDLKDHLRKDGTRILIAIRGQLIRLRNEEVVYCSFRDMTRKVQLERETKDLQAKLIQADKMALLGLLVSGIAHEINNPNNFIMINSTLLAEIWQDAAEILADHAAENGDFPLGGMNFATARREVPKLCGNITEGTKKICRIVDNLKGFARPCRGNGFPGNADLNRAAKEATAILAYEIRKYTDHFQLDLCEDLPAVRGNAQQIEQVIINLVLNALQSLPDKTGRVVVATDVESSGGFARLRVKDEGHGMDKKVLGRLAEPFFTTRINEGGTGLGLYISTAIIKEHRGFLEFESEPGRGTTTTIRLPIAGEHPAGCGISPDEEA